MQSDASTEQFLTMAETAIRSESLTRNRDSCSLPREPIFHGIITGRDGAASSRPPNGLPNADLPADTVGE